MNMIFPLLLLSLFASGQALAAQPSGPRGPSSA